MFTSHRTRLARVVEAVTSPEQLRDLLCFALVGASGYILNLAVYAGLLHAGLHYLPAAIGSFLVAVTNNYTWNRVWTFRARKGRVYDQGARFLLVSLSGLGANLLVLHALVDVGTDHFAAQAFAIVLVTPLNFLGSKLWAFGAPPRATG
jgi:dolichol-phosphate mannosyltransferase